MFKDLYTDSFKKSVQAWGEAQYDIPKRYPQYRRMIRKNLCMQLFYMQNIFQVGQRASQDSMP